MNFDVYGFRFRLHAGDPTPALEMLGSDFAFFRRQADGDAMEIGLYCQEPCYDRVPHKPATVYTPRNVSLTDGEKTFVDYGGRGLAVYDRGEPSFRIYSCDADLLYEASYLFLLSRIGEFLDARRLHRIHAMALSYRGRAVLAILPMGGGKSTLGAELLKCNDFDFLSDDSPFISEDGRVLAFPLRLGLLPGREHEIPPEYRRTINRMEFGPKVLVNYEYFAHRVKPSAEPGIVFLGRRSLAPNCRIEAAGRKEAMHSMLADCVIGLGLFQGLEFVVRASAVELAGKLRIGASRFRNARRLFASSQVCRLVLGRDPAENAATVVEFVRSRLGK
jgi:hypothetical protein